MTSLTSLLPKTFLMPEINTKQVLTSANRIRLTCATPNLSIVINYIEDGSFFNDDVFSAVKMTRYVTTASTAIKNKPRGPCKE